MTPDSARLLADFEAHDLGNTRFGHREHIQVAFEMVRKYGFLTALYNYANAIKSIATQAGTPEKFNLTVTLAFLSLIAERAENTPAEDFDTFLANNPDLLSKSLLKRWYGDERLQSELARRQFLMPD